MHKTDNKTLSEAVRVIASSILELGEGDK